MIQCKVQQWYFVVVRGRILPLSAVYQRLLTVLQLAGVAFFCPASFWDLISYYLLMCTV